MKKRVTLSVLSISLLVVVGILIKSSKSDRKDSISTISVQPNDVVFPVRVVVVHKGDLVDWISSSGYACPTMENEVKPKLNGQVVKLNVHNGTQVHKGDVLLQLDDRELLIDLQQAKDRLIKAQVDFNFANTTAFDTSSMSAYRHRIDSLDVAYRDAQENFKKGSLSQVALNRVKRDYDALTVFADVRREDIVANEIGLNGAESQYEYAKLRADYAILIAPFDGVVSDCLIQEGSYVQAAQPCMTIMAVSGIRISCGITEADIVRIRVGDETVARFVAAPGQTFRGRVVEINPRIDLQKRAATVIVEIQNLSKIVKPGMFATVKIASQVEHDVVLVPKSAVLFRENRPLVFTVLNGESQWVYVTLGKSNDDYYEIKEGISRGDTLVVDGNYNLAQASKTKIVELKEY